MLMAAADRHLKIIIGDGRFVAGCVSMYQPTDVSCDFSVICLVDTETSAAVTSSGAVFLRVF